MVTLVRYADNPAAGRPAGARSPGFRPSAGAGRRRARCRCTKPSGSAPRQAQAAPPAGDSSRPERGCTAVRWNSWPVTRVPAGGERAVGQRHGVPVAEGQPSGHRARRRPAPRTSARRPAPAQPQQPAHSAAIGRAGRGQRGDRVAQRLVGGQLGGVHLGEAAADDQRRGCPSGSASSRSGSTVDHLGAGAGAAARRSRRRRSVNAGPPATATTGRPGDRLARPRASTARPCSGGADRASASTASRSTLAATSAASAATERERLGAALGGRHQARGGGTGRRPRRPGAARRAPACRPPRRPPAAAPRAGRSRPG